MDKNSTTSVKLTKSQQEELSVKKTIRNIILAVLAVVIVVCIAVVIAKSSQPKLDTIISVNSDTIQLDDAVFSYFLHSNYNSFVSQNYYYLSYYGLSTSKLLKQQSYGNGTWFDYFVSQTKSTITELVTLAEAAKAKGISLDENDQKSIDRSIEAMKQAAASYSYSFDKYIERLYGTGVDEAAIRRSLELVALASKMYYTLNDGYSISTSETDTYLENNPSSFYKADYLYYTLKSTIPDGATDTEKNSINAATLEKANELAACTTQDAFKEWVENYIKTTNPDVTEESLNTSLNALLFTGKSLGSSTEVEKWAFNADTKVNDTFVSSGSNQYTVYMMVKTQYKDDAATKNIHHILFTETTYGSDDATKAKADEVLAEFNAGNKSVESFEALAKQYNEDSGSFTLGGKYTNVTKGSMTSEFDSWCFDENRKVGDAEVVKTSYGYHIILFDGDGVEAWRASAINLIKNEKYTADYNAFSNLYKVTFDDAKINKISA